MGKDRSGAGAEGGLGAVKPPPDRLYGRSRGHKLRPRQEVLLDATLPRLRRCRLTAIRALPPAALWLEVGFGGGEHALAQIARPSRRDADRLRGVRERHLLAAVRPGAGGAGGHAPLPANLRLWPDDARLLLRALPDACLDRLFLLFPDPWPKARHAKRRFVHPAMLPLLARVLKPGGEWRVASDDPTYQAWVRT